MKLELTIISPTSKSVVNVAWVEVETLDGNRVILPAHEPFLAVLKKHSSLIYATPLGVDGATAQTSIIIKDGIVSVTRSSVCVIIDESIA